MDRLIGGLVVICIIGGIIIYLIIYFIPILIILVLIALIIYWFANKSKQEYNDTKNNENVFLSEEKHHISSINYNIFNDCEDDTNKTIYSNSIINVEPIIQTSQQDEIIDDRECIYQTKDLRIIRNTLNKLDFNKFTKERLLNELISIESDLSDINGIESLVAQISEYSRDELIIYLKELKNLLNNTDLVNHETISSEDFINNRYPNSNSKPYKSDKILGIQNYNNTPKYKNKSYYNHSKTKESDREYWIKQEMANMYELGWDEPEDSFVKRHKEYKNYKEKFSNYEYFDEDEYDN